MDEQLLREKAKHFLVCYYEPCELREHCLRWLAGPYVPPTDRVQTCVNVMNKEVREGHCPLYKPDVPVQMMRGFTHLYDDMPRCADGMDGRQNLCTIARRTNMTGSKP